MTSSEDARYDATTAARPRDRMGTWVGAQSAPVESDAALAWAQVSGQRPQAMSKRSLVAVSHAIERAVLAAPAAGAGRAEQTVVIALFQRMEYFERERAVYERLAASGARTIVGFCEGPIHDLPAQVETVYLDPAESLVDEWAVVALSTQAGAFLVATDQHHFDAAASSLEAGRGFLSRWGFSRVQAAVELARLRLILGTRLIPDTLEVIDRLVGAAMPAGQSPAGSAGTPQDTWSSMAALHLADRLQSARAGSAQLRAQLADAHAAAAARHRAGTDPQSGLTTAEFLHRWSDTTGTTALPVGLAMFDLPAIARVGSRDTRAAYHAARQAAAALTEPLGPVDAAIRLSEQEFLVVVPGASQLHLARVCDEIIDQLALASDGYPHVELAGTVATTVTRRRPLPLADLNRARSGVDPDLNPGPSHAGTTAHGDPIIICSTRTHPLTIWPTPPPADQDGSDGATIAGSTHDRTDTPGHTGQDHPVVDGSTGAAEVADPAGLPRPGPASEQPDDHARTDPDDAEARHMFGRS